MSGSKSYPRSLPFRAPASVTPAPAPTPPSVPILTPLAPPAPRRSPLVPLAYCALFLVGLAAGSVLLRALSPRSAAAAGEKTQAEPSTAAPAATDDPVPAGGRAVGVSHPLGGAPEPGALVVPVAMPVPTLPDAVIETLGNLTASHLYQTYLNVGLLADAVEGETYEVADATKMLATIEGLTAAVAEQLAQLARQDVDGEDSKLVEQARRITTLLQTQAKELKSYWQTNDKDHAARFHKARQEAWTGIKSLLNIKE